MDVPLMTPMALRRGRDMDDSGSSEDVPSIADDETNGPEWYDIGP
jgi:hypothetical protein